LVGYRRRALVSPSAFPFSHPVFEHRFGLDADDGSDASIGLVPRAPLHAHLALLDDFRSKTVIPV
jgi:hypothetical protein